MNRLLPASDALVIRRQFAGQGGKFVIVEDGESGTSVIETTPSEVVTVAPGENGGMVISIEPVNAEPVGPVIVPPAR